MFKGGYVWNTPHRVSSLRHEYADVGRERSMDYLLSESHPNELVTTISLASTGEKLHVVFLSSINLRSIIHIFLT